MYYFDKDKIKIYKVDENSNYFYDEDLFFLTSFFPNFFIFMIIFSLISFIIPYNIFPFIVLISVIWFFIFNLLKKYRNFMKGEYYILIISISIQFLDIFSTILVSLLKYGNITSIARIEANPIFREPYIRANNQILIIIKDLILKITFGAYLSLPIIINKISSKYIKYNLTGKIDLKQQLKNLDINKINFFQGYKILNFTFFKLFIDIIMMMKIYFKNSKDIKFNKKESDFCFLLFYLKNDFFLFFTSYIKNIFLIINASFIYVVINNFIIAYKVFLNKDSINFTLIKYKDYLFHVIINVNTIILLISLIAYSFSYIKIKMSKVQTN